MVGFDEKFTISKKENWLVGVDDKLTRQTAAEKIPHLLRSLIKKPERNFLFTKKGLTAKGNIHYFPKM